MKKKIIKYIIIVLCFMVIITSSVNIYATVDLGNKTNELENNISNELTNNVEDELRELILNYNEEETIEESKKNDTTNIENYNDITSSALKTNGIYRITVGTDLNKVIEVAGSSIEDNAKVDIWNNGNVPAQKFYFEYEDGYYKITAMHTRKSLTVKDGILEEGTEIVQAEYEGLDSQKWVLRESNKDSWIISLLSNPQLSITVEGNIANGSKLILANTEDNDNQIYYLNNITASEQVKTNGIYRMAVGVDSNKVIEVAGSSTADNAKVDIWNNGSVPAQKFYLEYEAGYYKITAMHTGKCLTVKNGQLEAGAEIVHSKYEGLDSQKWILRDSNKNGWVISLFSNPQLSITVEGSIANGSKLILANTEDNNNQMYYLFNITTSEQTKDNGIYRLAVGADSNKVIEVAGSNTVDNAKVDIWDNGNVPAQKFYFKYENGYYIITAMHTGKCLTVKDGSVEEGAEIVHSKYEGLDSQKWILRDSNKNGWVISLLSNPQLSITVEGNIINGSKLILSSTEDNNNQMFYLFNITASEQTKDNGIYRLAVGADSNKVIEVAGSSTVDNAKVDVWDNGNVLAQKFNLEYENGYYKITAMHTGKSLTAKDSILKEGTEIVQAEYDGLDSQKWILRDSNKNGWVISLLSNPQLSITIEGNIENGSKLILANTEDNNNQMFYVFKDVDKNIKTGLYGMSGLMYKGTGGHYLEYYQIGNGDKHLFLNFSIHGFEDSYSNDGSELTYIANEFWEYLKNNLTDSLANQWTIYILPVSNPDGQYDGWSHNGPGRTTVYSWAPGNQGIDMNRCFPVGYTRTYSQRNYNGTEPLQAYEAQSLRDFILNNTGNQNFVIDVHGWLNETIGDNQLGSYYRDEFGMSTHIGTYGSGYLIQWARTIPNTRSMLLELPQVNNHNAIINNDYAGKICRATIRLLESI